VRHSPREVLGEAELTFMERMAEEEEAAAGSKKAEHKKIEQGQRTAAERTLGEQTLGAQHPRSDAEMRPRVIFRGRTHTGLTL